jgi:hypothetical protein
LAIGQVEYPVGLQTAGGTISRIPQDLHNEGESKRHVVWEIAFFAADMADEIGVTALSYCMFRKPQVAVTGGTARAAISLNEQLTRVITKLRLPIRKTRPSVKTVITLGLRKNASDANRCREGDAYLAQIRQSRRHRAGISFV